MAVAGAARAFEPHSVQHSKVNNIKPKPNYHGIAA